jgi:hypothetical protein
VLLEGLGKLKKSTSSGFDPATSGGVPPINVSDGGRHCECLPTKESVLKLQLK